MPAINKEAKRAEAALFLEAFRKIAEHQKPDIVSREKNKECLIDLGLTLTVQWKMILALEPENYVSGPDKDRDRSGFVWVFGMDMDGVEIYIKLKLVEYTPKGMSEPVRRAVCISFHRTTHSMDYPLKS